MKKWSAYYKLPLNTKELTCLHQYNMSSSFHRDSLLGKQPKWLTWMSDPCTSSMLHCIDNSGKLKSKLVIQTSNVFYHQKQR